MEHINEKLSITLSPIFSFITWSIGSWDSPIDILATFMFADFITGFSKSCHKNNTASKTMFNGIKKKIYTLFIVVVAVGVDRILGSEWTFRTLTLFYLISMEGLSILENLAEMGLPIPDNLLDKLIQISLENSTSDDEDGDINNETKS